MIFITATFSVKPEHADRWPEIEHFRAAQAELPAYLAATRRIVNVEVEQDDWSELGEMRVAG